MDNLIEGPEKISLNKKTYANKQSLRYVRDGMGKIKFDFS